MHPRAPSAPSYASPDPSLLFQSIQIHLWGDFPMPPDLSLSPLSPFLHDLGEAPSLPHFLSVFSGVNVLICKEPWTLASTTFLPSCEGGTMQLHLTMDNQCCYGVLDHVLPHKQHQAQHPTTELDFRCFLCICSQWSSVSLWRPAHALCYVLNIIISPHVFSHWFVIFIKNKIQKHLSLGVAIWKQTSKRYNIFWLTLSMDWVIRALHIQTTKATILPLQHSATIPLEMSMLIVLCWQGSWWNGFEV